MGGQGRGGAVVTASFLHEDLQMEGEILKVNTITAVARRMLISH